MINLSKLDNNPQGEIVKKGILNLDKTLNKLDLSKVVARVGVCVDYSGSMGSQYENIIPISNNVEKPKGLFGGLKSMFTTPSGDCISYMQKLFLRLMPLALRFDDNGEIDAWSFWDKYRSLKPLTLDNYDIYVDEYVKPYSKFGGTVYGDVLSAVVDHYDDGSKDPALVLFITDGDCSDAREKLDKFMRSISEKNMFILFIGMGRSSFEYLEHLDDLDGRPVDNTGFLKVVDFESLDDEQLYELLLKEFKNWLDGRQ